jgi:hypothetical protein
MYCLADGNALTDLGGQNAGMHDEETIVVGRAGGQTRVDIPQGPGSMPPAQAAPPTRSSHLFLKILLGFLAVGFLAAAAVVVGAIVYFNNSRQTDTAANLKSATPKPTASAKPSTNETDELRDQIAELEKLISEQKKDDKPVNVPLLRELSETKTARVDSPGDGFLALRKLPHSEIGERIAKIPHGATVEVGVCGPVVRPVNRAGRWCQASYNGQTGWVFDAYLVY